MMKFKFYKKVLKNGMTIIFEKRDAPVVSVAFAVRCGGMNEALGEKGISHFMEHLLYKGTPKRNSRQIAEEIEKNGGILNGFTDDAVTAYWCKLPSNKLNIALDVLGDMVKNPLFDRAEMDKERQVIFEEMKMYEDNPGHHVFHEIQKCLYEKPFGVPVIGLRETLTVTTREKMVKRFKEIYKPNNMILSVVGDADFKKIVSFAEKNFSDKTKGKVPQFDIKTKNHSGIEKRKGIDQANFVFAYHVPKSDDKKSYAAFVLDTILCGGMSSRLFHEIREKRNLAYAVKGYSNISKDFAYNTIFIATKKENVEGAKKLILAEFAKVAKSLDEKELAAAKQQILGHYKISMEDSQTQMVALMMHEINGDARELYDFEENIKKVKLADVKKLAKIKKYSFFALLPE